MTLISPGVAPQQVLRYRLTKGAKTESELIYDVRIKNDGQGVPSPALIVHLETTVEEVLADGAAKLRITVVRAAVQDVPGAPTGSELLRTQAAAMQGVVVTETLAPDGKAVGLHVDAAANLPGQAQAQLEGVLKGLEQVTTQLPAAPVGIGATWRERKTLPPGGIQGVAEVLYTITALTEDSFSYTSTGMLTGGDHTIEQGGVKLEVTHTRGHSTAEGRVDLARYALDVTASSVFSSTMNALAPKDTPGAGTSTIEIATATRISPVPNAPRPDGAVGTAQGAHKAP